MTIELIGFLVGLLVLLIFGFIYSLRFAEKVSLNERIIAPTGNERSYRVSNSSFGKFYRARIQKKVSDSTLLKVATVFGINIDVLQEKIELVGMSDDISAVEIVVYKILGILSGVLLGMAAFSSKNLILGIIAFISFAALFLLPADKVNDKVKEREQDIVSELPQFIEQVYLCIEAGASLREALEFVSRRTGGTLGKNFQDAFLRAHYTGRWEAEVLEMVSTLKVEALEDFVNDILIASEKGVSIHDTLRKEVETITMVKKAIDKERIGTLSTKIILPMMIFFILPMFIIVMLPPLLDCLKMLE